MISPDAALSGIQPALRPELPGADSGILALMVSVFIVCAFCVPPLKRVWGSFLNNLSRPAATTSALPGVERTLVEKVDTLAALLQLFVFEGVTLFAATMPAAGVSVDHPFLRVLLLTLLAAAMFLFQYLGYEAVGFAFTTKANTRAWLRGFTATQSMLGFALIIPAAGALFYPHWAGEFLALAGALYVVARILFYIKGFRIFYTNEFSIFHFFLYLCTLEITPLIVVAALASRLSETPLM